MRFCFLRAPFCFLGGRLELGRLLLQARARLTGLLLFCARGRHHTERADVAKAGTLELLRERPVADGLAAAVVDGCRVEGVGDALEHRFVRRMTGVREDLPRAIDQIADGFPLRRRRLLHGRRVARPDELLLRVSKKCTRFEERFDGLRIGARNLVDRPGRDARLLERTHLGGSGLFPAVGQLLREGIARARELVQRERV